MQKPSTLLNNEIYGNLRILKPIEFKLIVSLIKVFFDSKLQLFKLSYRTKIRLTKLATMLLGDENIVRQILCQILKNPGRRLIT